MNKFAFVGLAQQEDGPMPCCQGASKPGAPVAVTLDGTYSPSSLVVFGSLGITKKLKGAKTVVAFTLKKAGKIVVACRSHVSQEKLS